MGSPGLTPMAHGEPLTLETIPWKFDSLGNEVLECQHHHL